MSQLRDDLKAVHDLLDKGWCQGVYARDSEGTPISSNAHEACRYCLSGAINKTCFGVTYSDTSVTRSLAAGLAIEVEAGRKSLADFNDTHTKAQVLDLVQRAYEAAS